MKRIFLSILVIWNFVALAQNLESLKTLSEKSIKQWYNLSTVAITDNGLTVMYKVDNFPEGSNTTYISSLSNGGSYRILESSQAQFTRNSKYLLFSQYNTIQKLDLNTFKSLVIGRASHFTLAENNRTSWLIYRSSSTTELVFRNLANNRTNLYPETHNFVISKDQTKAVIIPNQRKNGPINKIIYKNLITGNEEEIAIPNTFSDGVFSSSGMIFLFKVENPDKSISFRYYNTEDSKVYELELEKQLKSEGLKLAKDLNLEVSVSDNFILFYAERSKEKEGYLKSPLVWSFHDAIQGYDKELPSYKRDYLNKKLRVAYNINTSSIVLIESEGEHAVSYSPADLILLAPTPNSQSTYNKGFWPFLDILDLNTGKKTRVIQSKSTRYFSERFSPDGKFAIWFDSEQRKWFSYDITTGEHLELASKISSLLYDKESWDSSKRLAVWGVAGWTPDDAVLLYDAYDIWKVSLRPTQKPINITKNYGRENQIVLSIVGERNSGRSYDLKKELLIRHFDPNTKSGGYSFFNPTKDIKLKNANLQPYSVSSRTPLFFHDGASDNIIKAKFSRKYLVVRESAEDSPNAYLTSDFRNYTKLSDIRPEKAYKWFTAELVKWRGLDGADLSGILYKPKYIDSNKKYPVIFNYYESRSDELHKYLRPDFSRDNINIPLFVAQGYFIFVPDVISKSGFNGEGSFNAIESAAMILAKFPNVDSTKFALQGHSYGGWQTNYLITRSKRFVAACEVAGVSNHISAYGTINHKGTSRIRLYEANGQGSAYGLGRTPWTDPQLYLSNSPVISIGNISTPLLMVHNRDDTQVPFNQAIEMYVGMQRAGKKVWLLQYDDGYGHNFGRDDVAASDFHTKMLQFFGYYLKGAPPPNWMEGLSTK